MPDLGRGEMDKLSMDLQITYDDLENQLGLLNQMPEIEKRELGNAVYKGNAIMKSKLKARVKAFSGSTVKSIGSTIKRNLSTTITGITGPNSKEAKFHLRIMQTGRKPGRMPPIDDFYSKYKTTSLLEYVKRNDGISDEKEARVKAFGMARHISEHGTKGEQIVRPVMEENRSRIEGVLKDAVDKIVNLMRVK